MLSIHHNTEIFSASVHQPCDVVCISTSCCTGMKSVDAVTDI